MRDLPLHHTHHVVFLPSLMAVASSQEDEQANILDNNKHNDDIVLINVVVGGGVVLTENKYILQPSFPLSEYENQLVVNAIANISATVDHHKYASIGDQTVLRQYLHEVQFQDE